MVNILLGISLTLNVIFLIVGFFYLKFKLLGVKNLKKSLQSKFLNPDEFDMMLNNLDQDVNTEDIFR